MPRDRIPSEALNHWRLTMTKESKLPKLIASQTANEVALRHPLSTVDQIAALRAIARTLVEKANALEGIALREVA